MVAHELERQAVVAFPEYKSPLQPRPHFIPPAAQFSHAGPGVDVRGAKHLLRRGDHAAQLAALSGGEPAYRRQQPLIDADFLSYSHEDAVAVTRICDALRSESMEGWFDQSELRHGDAWDAKIRLQIKEWAQFMTEVAGFFPDSRALEGDVAIFIPDLAVHVVHSDRDDRCAVFVGEGLGPRRIESRIRW